MKVEIKTKKDIIIKGRPFIKLINEYIDLEDFKDFIIDNIAYDRKDDFVHIYLKEK